MPHFIIVLVLLPYINLVNLSWIIKCLFLRNMKPLILMQLKNCKHMFGPHRGPLPSTSSVKYHYETHMTTNTLMKQCEGLNGDLKIEHKKTTKRARLQTLMSQAPNCWNRERTEPSLDWALCVVQIFHLLLLGRSPVQLLFFFCSFFLIKSALSLGYLVGLTLSRVLKVIINKSWSCFDDFDTRLEAFPHQDVINLVVIIPC